MCFKAFLSTLTAESPAVLLPVLPSAMIALPRIASMPAQSGNEAIVFLKYLLSAAISLISSGLLLTSSGQTGNSFLGFNFLFFGQVLTHSPQPKMRFLVFHVI